jgi:lysophospholipase L1-like esterase
VVIPAGVGGNTSKDMLKRLDTSVLDKKPDWMTLSCGVNDVWHGANGVPLDDYKTNITSIVDQATAAGIKVVLLEATLIGENQANSNNQKLIAYNNFLHELATEKHLPIVPLNSDEQAELAREKAETPGIKGNILTVDGVHMNALGNQMMASGILKTFGFTAAQIAQAKEAWMTLPNAEPLNLRLGCTAADYLKLRAIATAQGQTVDEMLSGDLTRDIQSHLSAATPGGNPPAKP